MIIVNGLIEVVKNLKVDNILISKQSEVTNEYTEFINIAKKKKTNIIIVKSGDRIEIDDETYIEIIYPGDKLCFDDINNNSIVAKIVYKNFKMLFTGDIEKEAENLILDKYCQELKANLIKIPHHGSNTSSSEEFLKIVSPEVALIGVGEENNFGHPSSEVLLRLNKIKCKIFRTDLNGEITLKINKKGRILVNKIINN